VLTRCPACDTHFRVTAEQIKARLGRVRCGACQHAFNALDSLIEEPMLATTTPSVPAHSHFAPRDLAPPSVSHATEPDAAVSPATEGNPFGAPTLEADFAPVPEFLSIPETASHAPGPEPREENQGRNDAGEPIPAPVDAGADTDSAAAPIDANDIGSEPGEDATAPVSLETEAAPTEAPANEVVEPDDSATADELPEGNEAVAEPQPRRWPWITGILIAVIALGLQATLAFRVELAVLWPETKPALVALCDLAGCEVGLPAKVGLVGIEASDLHPDTETKGRLTLTATLKNRAPFAQEFPHLELTLTDTADKPVARKVLAPADYLPARTPTADGMPPNADIAVAVRVDSGEMAASGYRLYLFFP
jgi:predicted Zn finger-like uncharacterized protein